MKTLNVFARYFALIAMLFIANANAALDSLPPCPEPECPVDSSVPPTEHYTTACTFDAGTNSSCCVKVHFRVTRRHPCGMANFPYYTFDILNIEAVGDCYMDQTQVMKTAVSAVASASMGFNLNKGRILLPACIEAECDHYSNNSQWVPCNPTGSCCKFDFEVGWDSTAGDTRLLNSRHLFAFFKPQCSGIYPTCINCNYNCANSLFPENGLLDLADKLPYPCGSSCIKDPNHPTMNVQYNSGGNLVTGEFTIGNDGGTPCLNLHYMWIIAGSFLPNQALEALISQALGEYRQKFGLGLVKVNVWTCMTTFYPSVPLYSACMEDCCQIEFDLNGSLGNYFATVINKTSMLPECPPSCYEMCDIFAGSYPIAKLSSQEIPDVTNNHLKIKPNPTTGLINVEFETDTDGSHQIKVIDLLGHIVFNHDVIAVKGLNSFNLNMSNIVNGVYNMQVFRNGMLVSNIKFIRN